MRRTLTPRPVPPPSPGEGRRTVLRFWSCFSPSSPGEGGGRGREKRAGVMRVFLAGILGLGFALAAAQQAPESPATAGLQRVRTAQAKADVLSQGCLTCHAG